MLKLADRVTRSFKCMKKKLHAADKDFNFWCWEKKYNCKNTV